MPHRAFTASGGTYGGSTGAPSGITAQYGEWAVFKQSLNMSYRRVPFYSLPGQGGTIWTDATLAVSSIDPNDTMAPEYTYLEMTYDVECTCQQVSGYYASSIPTPQKFTITSDSPASHNGLGHEGQITTHQPYYEVRPWVSGLDTEYTEVAANFDMFTVQWPDTININWPTECFTSIHVINGAYDLTHLLDTDVQAWNTINMVGVMAKQGHLNGCNPWAGAPHYDILKHSP